MLVQFVVDTEGRVTEPAITEGLGHGIDEGVLRCVRDLQFTPGRQDGKPVRVRMSLPVTFRLR